MARADQAESLYNDNIYYWDEQELANEMDQDIENVKISNQESQQNKYVKIEPISQVLLTVEVALLSIIVSVLCCIFGGIIGYCYSYNYCVKN